MRKTCTAIVLLCLIAGALCACGGTPTGQRLSWRKVGEGEGWNTDDGYGIVDELVYIGEDPRLLIIDDPLAVPSLKFRVHPRDLERVAKTDFSRFWVAVIYQGRRDSYPHVRSTRVRGVRMHHNTVYVRAEFRERYTGSGRQSRSPYYVLRIKKPAGMAGEPAFALNTGTQVVPQLCAIPGEHMPWEPIAKDFRGSRPGVEVPPGLAVPPSLWIVQTPHEAPPDHPSAYYSPATGISLRTHFGVVAYQGQGATGHAIDVLSVKRRDDQVLVCAQFIAPSWGPQDVVYPYYVFQVERTEELRGKITPFLLLDDGTEVARRVAVIG